MSKIDELIQRLCPDGVEYRGLGEVCEIADNKRKPVKSSLRISGENPYYGANNIQDYVEGFTHDGDYVLIAEDGSASLERYSIQYATGRFWANNHVHVIRGQEDLLISRFVYHFLGQMNFVPFLSGGTRAKLTKTKMVTIKFPIPPLEVQREIVDILDKFTQFEAELEAELEARKKQYEFYRDQLLTFDDAVEKITIQNLFNLKNGYTPSKSNREYWTNGTVPWFRMEDIRENGGLLSSSLQSVNKSAVKGSGLFEANSLLVATSATIGEHALIELDFLANQRFTILTAKDKFKPILNMKFIYYYAFLLDKWCLDNTITSSFSSVDMSAFKRFKIPMPPLSEQNRIVAILDKFDALVNDTSIGLPAELAARRKQYEYYRSKLLTFKEAV